MLRAVLLIAAACAMLLGSATSRAVAEANGLALTPPMGWNNWYEDGCNFTAQSIEQTASAMVANGMKAAGYRYVNVDDCWMAQSRDSSGNLVPDPAKFPNGIVPVIEYVHSLGLEFGIYEDAGVRTCAHDPSTHYPGSYGHEAQDADTFASWGVDYLKYDRCNIPFQDFSGQSHEQVNQTLYTRMSNALKATGRPIVFAMCDGPDPAVFPWLWGASVSNLWRTGPDVMDTYPAMLSAFEANAALYRYAHPGGWNDPDNLQIGNGGMSTVEYRTQFSLWAEMAAPLIAGVNPAALSPAELSIYENRGVIAIDQDPLGQQGIPIAHANGLWVLTKPLQAGDRAIVLFNSTSGPATVATTAAAAGLPPGRAYRLRDLWSDQVSESGGRVSAFLAPHAAAMFRVSVIPRASSADLPPHTTLSIVTTPRQADSGRPITARESLVDNGSSPVLGVRLALRVPRGWKVTALGPERFRRLAGGHTLTARFRVLPPVSTQPIATVNLAGTASYAGIGRRRSSVASLEEMFAQPPRRPFHTVNTTGAPTAFGMSGGVLAIRAGGVGILPASSAGPQTPPSDSYAAIYLPGAAGLISSMHVLVTAQSHRGRSDAAGLIYRDAISVAGSPEGAAVYVSARGAVGMAWNASGGPDVDSSYTLPGVSVSTPVSLRLVRDGNTYTGYYSAGRGSAWTEVDSVSIAPDAAEGSQDAGVFHASGTLGDATEADFSDFGVS